MKKFLLFLSLLGLVAGEGTAGASTFFFNFDTGRPTQMTGGNLESVQGYTGLGSGSNIFSGDFLRNESGGYGITPTPTKLILTGLPAHDRVRLGFLLAVIDSWDGNSKEKIDGYQVGPDYFNVKVDNILIFHQTFSNFPLVAQSYSGDRLGSGLSARGFNPSWLDSAYDLSLDIPHTGATLTVKWFANGAGWQGINAQFGNTHDESWAIDNVRVDLFSNGVPVPLPASAPLLGAGLLGLGLRGFRKKSSA
jgi:hypothetical protein